MEGTAVLKSSLCMSCCHIWCITYVFLSVAQLTYACQILYIIIPVSLCFPKVQIITFVILQKVTTFSG